LIRTADKCLDDYGKVLYGMKQVTDKSWWERKYCIHFMHNSLLDMADNIGLLPVIGLPYYFPALILGLFVYHIAKAIIHLQP
jgi:hypothetical protein